MFVSLLHSYIDNPLFEYPLRRNLCGQWSVWLSCNGQFRGSSFRWCSLFFFANVRYKSRKERISYFLPILRYKEANTKWTNVTLRVTPILPKQEPKSLILPWTLIILRSALYDCRRRIGEILWHLDLSSTNKVNFVWPWDNEGQCRLPPKIMLLLSDRQYLIISPLDEIWIISIKIE